MSDKSLIQKIKNGNREAFNSFCSSLYPNMIAYAQIFLSEEWAEDVVQDVFFSIWQNRKRLNENFNVNSYLFRSVKNGALNYIKLQRHSNDFREWNYQRIAEATLTSIDFEKDTVLKKLYESDLRNTLNQAIDQLSPRQREIFKMSYLDEMSSKEIGQALDLSPRTVESHLYEALKTLRKHLSSDKMVPVISNIIALMFWTN